jgi:hypothetical protein
VDRIVATARTSTLERIEGMLSLYERGDRREADGQ